MPGAPTDPRQAVSIAVRQVLDREAKRNELGVAYVRVAGFGAVLLIDLVTASLGLRPWWNAGQTLTATAIAIGLWVFLRRTRVHPASPIVVPMLDVVLLYVVLEPRLAVLGASVGLTATTSLVCALFALTGTLRFRRPITAWTTSLAGLLLVLLLAPHARVYELAYSVAAIGAIGMLAWSIADLVRRSMEGAASHTLLARFLPQDLVDNAFHNPLTTFGEPRTLDATVLMSDLRGFTALAENLPPDRVFSFLSQLQGELARVVKSHGGVVDKFLGDGMLAVFGLSGDADHEARAVAAAQEIRRVVAELAAANVLGAPVRVGIGLHAGPLVAGWLGSGDRLESTVIGDTVNTAARLESMTKDHNVDVLLTAAVVRRAGPIGAIPLGSARVRGREQELEIYTLP